MNNYLELIIGPMFSSKTTALIEIHNKCKFCEIPVIVINHASDTRYHDTMISTHDKVMIPCIQSNNLLNVWEEITRTNVILINEGQFFPDLYDIVVNIMNNLSNKKVYICGLDGDFKRNKFGQILDLIPYCDKIQKLTSICSLCRDGTPGIFSMRLTNEKEQMIIGSDNYIPVCRNCYKC